MEPDLACEQASRWGESVKKKNAERRSLPEFFSPVYARLASLAEFFRAFSPPRSRSQAKPDPAKLT